MQHDRSLEDDDAPLPPAELEIHLSPDELQRMSVLFGNGHSPWISWGFPGYKLTLRVDRARDGPAFLVHAGSLEESRRRMDISVPSYVLEADVLGLVRRSFEEVLRCFEQSCFVASIVMCGKIIETILASSYARTFAKNLRTDRLPGIADMIRELRKAGFQFPAGLAERMDVISKHRNVAVHGAVTVPTQDEARSTIYLVRDTLLLLSQSVPPQVGSN